MNELEFYDGDEDPDTAGFRRILVTEPTHPYVGRLVAAGARARLRALVHPPGRRPGPRHRRGPRPGAVVRRRAAGAAGARRRRALGRQRAAGRTSGGELMARPITLFTGQWADLPFEEVARLAAEWGYDGLEIACWGDHLDPWAAAEDDAYVRGRRDILEKHGLQVFAISNHLTGQAVCDDPIDERHRGILPARVWGDGEPEGVRRRAAEAMKVTARAAARARRRHGRRVHRVEDLEDRGDVPAGAAVDGRRRLPGLRRPLEPDPRRVRRGRRAVRARGAPQRDRLRLLDGRARAGGDRAPARRSG